MSVHTTDKNLTVPEALRKCADLFESRNPEYGNNYERFGLLIELLFPNGLDLKTISDYNRYGVFTQMIGKIMRYANNFNKGHPDSLDDLSVYSQMLRDLDNKK